jgi:hypothetical protein
MDKLRVLYIHNQFPQISETYIKSEIEAVKDECEVLVIGLDNPDIAYKNHAPYRIIGDWDKIVEAIEEFRPDVLHCHWLYNIWKVDYFAKQTNIPYTIRAHSFDILMNPAQHHLDAVPLINDDLCLGIIVFPFGRMPLENIGIRGDKLHDCYPVVNYRRFYDRSPNGDAIMNVGACLPKKKMIDFLKLAALVPDTDMNLYALGYDVGKIDRLNQSMGTDVNIIPAVEPDDMPAEYKKHRWLVYTASPKIGTVGWPMAIAEAQASGVGVCMANLRPDLREYVGPCGFIFDSLSEVADIVSKPFPNELREIGFEHARKSDVFEHKTILMNLWRKARSSRGALAAQPARV